MKRRLWHWINRRDVIPLWVKLFWRRAHWCPEMDGLLILDNTCDCFCGYVKHKSGTCKECGAETELRFIHEGGCMNCDSPDIPF